MWKLKLQICNVFYYRSVGKSSLAIQFVQGQFVDYYEPTIENTFNKTINIKGSVTPVVAHNFKFSDFLVMTLAAFDQSQQN